MRRLTPGLTGPTQVRTTSGTGGSASLASAPTRRKAAGVSDTSGGKPTPDAEQSGSPGRGRWGRLGGRLTRLVPSSRRGRLIGAAVALLAVAGVAAWFVFGRPQAEPAATTQTLTISASTLKQTVTASGTLEPERRADLTLPSGTVASVRVVAGDQVTEGETLATTDPTALTIALSSAQADLTAARENLSDLQSSAASTASINAASATVQVKRNAVTQAQANLASATLTAPFAGVVAEVNVAVGDTSGPSSGSSGAQGGASGTGSSSSSSSSAAIVLISQGTFTVSTSVSSGDVASLKQGLQAVITPQGSSQTVYGTVASVGVIATTATSGSATFPVTIDVTGSHDDLRAGSTVSVEIVTRQLTDVLAVPTQALTTADGKTTVTKLVDGKKVEQTVATGEVVGSQTVITEGLAEGDQIVMTGFRVGQASGTEQSGGFPGGADGFPGGNRPAGGFSGGGQGGQGRGNR